MLTSVLSAAWHEPLKAVLSAPTTAALEAFLRDEMQTKPITPAASEYFRALDQLAPSDVRVVILGQDPYHGQGQAEGLAFSVPPHIPIPPSLRNIFKELDNDIPNPQLAPPPRNGHLGAWVEQGVLLLNSVLSTRIGEAASHANKGWEPITDEIIRVCNQGAPKVFILWGKYAQNKARWIDEKHKIIASAHPSPLSAYQGFWGSKPFSQANAFLQNSGYAPIEWHERSFS